MFNEKALNELRGGFSGNLVLPADAGYDEARKVFNAMIDKRPMVIARCASTRDVVAAVDFGRDHGLEVSVRGGGHSVAGLSIGEGILIDLSGLKRIAVDTDARIARAGGGMLWGELDRATQAYGLHTPGGRVTTTGVGGFTTGGGYGWTSSKYGLACDNLLSAEVVTANGRVVSASASENTDLFWGIRGGGGNFGVVTRFDFRLHPLGPTVLAGLAMWPMERAPDVLRAWRDLADAAPDELSTASVVLIAPPEPFVPDALKGQPVLGIAAIYVGDPQAGLPLVKPIKALGPAVDLIQPMPYTDFQAMLDPTAPPGKRSYWRGEYMAKVSDEAIEAFLNLAPAAATAGFPLTQTIVFRIGQGVSAVPDDASAFSHRDARYLFHPIMVWDSATDDTRLIAIGRELAETMRQFVTGGAYLNFTPESDRVRDAYGVAKYERLMALKSKYDPQNLFRGNQNIRPSDAPR
ncbi:MAG: FAD-binding oxidoreductase [Candidatus Schekmanbacteria bacterium]|nr:FAD-binding oxidoreductase [Candidatus Schekmanbacteria bacterium]